MEEPTWHLLEGVLTQTGVADIVQDIGTPELILQAVDKEEDKHGDDGRHPAQNQPAGPAREQPQRIAVGKPEQQGDGRHGGGLGCRLQFGERHGAKAKPAQVKQQCIPVAR